jgi:hypothetical protein
MLQNLSAQTIDTVEFVQPSIIASIDLSVHQYRHSGGPRCVRGSPVLPQLLWLRFIARSALYAYVIAIIFVSLYLTFV